MKSSLARSFWASLLVLLTGSCNGSSSNATASSATDGSASSDATADSTSSNATESSSSSATDTDTDTDTTADFYPPEHCAYFLTGEVDVEGTDADGDGVANGWDHCPNNPVNWLDSDRDGLGNLSDLDMDGDGIANDEDPDRDGDGASDSDEEAAGTDPSDPSSIPGVPYFDLDLGVLNPDAGWYRGDLHVHSQSSHDSIEPVGNYVAAAKKAGLDFTWITDHRIFEAPFDPAWDQSEILFIPAIEWGGGGHANIGGIRTDIAADYEDASDIERSWRLARLQGAVQSLNHYGQDPDYWDLMLTTNPALLGALDVMEVWNSPWAFNTDTNDGSLAYWQELLNEGYRIGAVGGSDTHSAELTIGTPTTVVWANSLSVPAILDGIRRGRTYVTQAEPFLDGMSINYSGRAELEFTVDADSDGDFEAMLGDEVAPGEITLRIAVNPAHGPVALIRNGVQVALFDGHEAGADIVETFTETAPAGAWYRVEMRQPESPGSMLLLSSPIYVAK